MSIPEPVTRSAVWATRREVEIDGVKRTLFVASTAASDRMDDIVDQETWKLANYEGNPVVLVDHDYAADSVVGRGKVGVVAGIGLTLEVEKWSSKPRAQEVKADVDEGIINAVSVGFRPGRAVARRAHDPAHPYYKADGYGYAYYDCELLEVSIVAIPANPEALAVRQVAPDMRALAEQVADLVMDKLSSDPTRAALLSDILREHAAPLAAESLFASDSGGALDNLFK